MASTVIFDVNDRIATITLNRPDKRNAINREMRAELSAAFERVRDDESIWIAVIRGAAGNFSTGHDLSESLDGSPTVADLYALQHQLEKPMISAIAGACLAQGCGIALGCDIRLADDTAFFAWPQVRRGIASISGPTILARSVPLNVAMEYLLTGDNLSAGTAADLRLIKRVPAGSDVHVAAHDLAVRIASNAPLAVRGMKRAVRATQGLQPIEAFRVASAILAEIEKTQDAKEGMRAFAEKRAPVWSSR